MTGHPRIPCGEAAPPASPAIGATPGRGDDKAALRAALAAARRAIDPAQKAQWDAAIGARVLAWWRLQAHGGAAVLGVYWPLRGEPDLHAAYAELARILPAGTEPDIRIVWDPPWNPSMMSEKCRLRLGWDGTPDT